MKNKEKFYEDILEAFTNYKECEFKVFRIYKREDCSGISCTECAKKIKQWLEEEYKEPIKLTQFEYDLIMNCFEVREEVIEGYNDNFETWWILKCMKEKGYFKEVNSEMELSEILDNCEIVEY